MLSWVVKVVPQPPEPPSKKAEEQNEEKPADAPPPAPTPSPVQEKKVTFQDECKNEAPAADQPKQEVQTPEGNGPAPGSQPGVLTWISSALPQPAVSPRLSRANSTTKEEDAPASKPEDEKGMMAWIAQGLEKVVPQPDVKISATAEPPAEEPELPGRSAAEQVPPAPPAPAPAAEIQPTVTETKPEQEDQNETKPLPPRMLDWIKQGIEKVVPQPETHVRSKTEEKPEAPAASKAEAPAPEAPPGPTPAADGSSTEAEQQPNMVSWIVSGIERMLPQPVQKQAAGGDDVQNRGKGGESP